MSIKFCKDCRWAKWDSHAIDTNNIKATLFCRKPVTLPPDPVWGREIVQDFRECDYFRRSTDSTDCGMEAKYFDEL